MAERNRGEDERRVEVGTGYPLGQLARAFVTALTAEDEDARTRAEARLEKWEAVLRGITSGKLRVGSRTPVEGLPGWVTLEVIRGGFATGEAAAAGPITPSETETARDADVPAERDALFAWFLTEPGLEKLAEALEHGTYRVALPEEAALLVATWLGRHGDEVAAVALVRELAPFADRLRFSPTFALEPIGDLEVVSRETVGDVRMALERRRENDRVEAMREALTVWAPFADEFLSLFIETVEDGRVATRVTPDWLARAGDAVSKYQDLALRHTRCTKHRSPKENLAILRSAAEELVRDGELADRRRGLLQHAVDSMIARRGGPGTDQHASLRSRQAADALIPSHKRIGDLVATRLGALPQDRGTPKTAELLRPVAAEEARATGLPERAPVPSSVERVVNRAAEAPVEALLEAGLVPSAEALAELAPQVAAECVAAAFTDPALSRLVAVHYLAFRDRRSLLLLNLERQVQIDELPWMRAIASHGGRGTTAEGALDALQRLAMLAIDHFPGTLFPNPFVEELEALAREAGLDVPFVEELAADIFMGTFSAKFLRAAQVAAESLRGSLYERYYGIDYHELVRAKPDRPQKDSRGRTASAFADICRRRAGDTGAQWSVAGNGVVVEQAQILTTHNLATLAGPVGLSARLENEWDRLARRSAELVLELVSKLRGNPRPLATVKDAAYAWRQLIFYLSVAAAPEQLDFVTRLREQVKAAPREVSAALEPALVGLEWVASGNTFDDAPSTARRFLGWSVGGHWMLAGHRTAPTI